MKTLSTNQLDQAIEMHESGIKWELIAAFFEMHTQTLTKQIKTYEKTSSRLHSTA